VAGSWETVTKIGFCIVLGISFLAEEEEMLCSLGLVIYRLVSFLIGCSVGWFLFSQL
jgi:hypothetical protein